MSFTGAIFTLLFLTGCALAFTRHPVWGVATYMSTFFLSPPLRWWGQGVLLNVRWAFIAAGVTFLAIVFSKSLKRPELPWLSHGAMWILLAFVAWLGLQSFWAMDTAEHSELLSYYIKFFLSIYLVYRCVDSEKSLKILLWTYVLGCFYFGWIAFTEYTGGRFEGFGGAGIGEANAGALTVTTGAFVAAALMLDGNLRVKAVVVGFMPFIVNALVTTVSRSGFLAFALGGIVFNLFTPPKFRKVVRRLSILGGVLLLILAGPTYWERIQSIQYAGENVEGVDTGSGRLKIIQAQWRIFTQHPFGCGAMCTASLSSQYLDASDLVQVGDTAVRSSHNTVMSMLAEHGVPGLLFYVGMLLWLYKNIRALARQYRSETGFLPTLLPAVAAVAVAIVVGDMFVSYVKYEVRLWFVAILMVMVNIAASARREPVKPLAVNEGPVPEPAMAAAPSARAGLDQQLGRRWMAEKGGRAGR